MSEESRFREVQRAVRAKATPQQTKFLQEFDEIFNLASQNFSDNIDRENELRFWANNLLEKPCTVSDLESLFKVCSRQEPRAIFFFKDVALFLDDHRSLHNATRYIFALEKAVMDYHQKAQAIETLEQKGFFALIAYAFKKLFQRRSK